MRLDVFYATRCCCWIVAAKKKTRKRTLFLPTGFLEETGSIHLQFYCCVLDFGDLLLFPNSPYCGFHHLSSCATDRCDGVDEFAQRILGRYRMFVHC